MSDFSDHELSKDSGELPLEGLATESGEEESGGVGPVIWVWVFLAILSLGVIVYWFFIRSPAPPPPVERAEVPVQKPVAPAPEPEPPPPVDPGLPSLAASDAFVRQLVGTVSSSPQLATWLLNDTLIERFVLVVSNVAYDENASVHVPFLRPEKVFSVVERGDGLVVDSRSYGRFDRIADVIESLDVEGSVATFEKLEPLMQEFYVELGYPGSFRQTLTRAFDRIAAVPLERAGLRVREKVISYELVEPRLEALSDSQKALLRMGPENVQRIQAKVEAIRRQLGL